MNNADKHNPHDLMFRRYGSPYYQQSQPIDILLNTSRPEDPEHSFITVMASPDLSYLTSLPCSDPRHPLHRRGLHQHTYYELLYVCSGSMYQKIENRRHLYTAGSLCLLNHHVRHAEEYDTDFQCAFMALDDSLIREILYGSQSLFSDLKTEDFFSGVLEFFRNGSEDRGKEYIDFIPRDSHPEETDLMHRRFEALFRHILDPGPGSSFHIKGILSEIFASLCDAALYDTIPIRIGSEKEAGIFEKINDLILASKGRITRNELSESLLYDGSYLNRIVQKYTGMSIFAYGNTICMKEAARLLEETDLPVQTISEQLRFSNRTHFYRLFEDHWQMTPSSYRKLKSGKMRGSKN